MKVIEDPEAVAKLRSGVDREKNLDLLRSDYGVSPFLSLCKAANASHRSILTRLTRFITLDNTNTPLEPMRMPQTSYTIS